MKRLLYFVALAPTFLQAETFVIDTKVSEVTVYPEGAEITRTGTFDVPAGRHRLVLLGIPGSDYQSQLATMQFHAEGLTQTAVIARADDVPWHDYESEDVKQAEQHIEDIEAQIIEVEDRANTALTKAEAARQKIAFLSDLGRNEGLAGANAGGLRDIARMVGDESLLAEEAVQSAEIEARKIRKNLDDLEKELDAARADLAALIPETDDRLFLAVDVQADADVSSTISVSYLDFYFANWQPLYEFDLTTGDNPQVTISRHILVNQHTGENWQDVTLNVSTLQPVGQNSATDLRPLRRFIRNKPAPVQSRSVANLAEPVVEAPVVVEETQGWAPSADSVQGTGFTYTLSNPVSIASSENEFAEFFLDRMAQDAEVFAMATPARDDVAYRTARFLNPYDQNLLSANLAKWLVDGVLVATNYTDTIGPSEEVEMGFGPIHGLTLKRDILNRSSGDVGLISRSNESVEHAQIEVKNLTNESWTLRLLDRVPYSEQDDLEINWTADPKPLEVDVANQRGILAWNFDLTPGQTETIKLETTLGWPEGMELR
ncbi:hypothetical protein RA27_14190 [Ruegeria sp. ANG-R]|uniref:mucoidy inhibitor MuiA family protein n=1 Tax=Ruegeria sp. ANG-R TaxID=1577903 RepID=UPI00057CAD2F|nr:mucoidy inhibitor MuiA family protein [Ruegeria sp. ANG-R]KIC40437.1 hypothetical protein RA27_14190 [Ruegeria sp. ANG-R]